jgi:hypothetical protein
MSSPQRPWRRPDLCSIRTGQARQLRSRRLTEGATMKIHRPRRSRRPVPDVMQCPATGLAVCGGPVGAACDPQSHAAGAVQHDVLGSRDTIVIDDVPVRMIIPPSPEVRVAVNERSGHRSHRRRRFGKRTADEWSWRRRWRSRPQIVRGRRRGQRLGPVASPVGGLARRRPRAAGRR